MLGRTKRRLGKILALMLTFVFAVSMSAAFGMTANAAEELYDRHVTHLRGNNNQTYSFLVKGRADQSIWGGSNGIYTDDSTLSTAAVHAGVVAVGETKTVIIRILPGRESYTGSTRNGITSRDYGSWPGSYEFVNSAAAPAPTTPATTNANTLTGRWEYVSGERRLFFLEKADIEFLADGQVKEYTYGSVGRISELTNNSFTITNATGSTYRFTYTMSGNNISITDSANDTVTWRRASGGTAPPAATPSTPATTATNPLTGRWQ
ncbi:MAG: LCCL domain-containing protein, partial [Defluviitaleaceae bacterium]|nr:LCCL domain-containing protein [Defluviitaleaceae bacterium]